MNVQIVDLTPEYIDGALDVFYESNLLHCSGAPDYFRKIPKEHSRPYMEWIIRNENTFGLVALADGKVAGIVFAAKEEKPDTLFLYQRYYKIYDIAAEYDLEMDGDIIIKRTISADGRGKILFNDQIITLKLLRELSRCLIEIHDKNVFFG